MVRSNDRADLSENVGSVLLGLEIAEDIFNGARKKRPRKSTVGPRT
jgi:hypothetical protein